jgi:hypothetical protein
MKRENAIAYGLAGLAAILVVAIIAAVLFARISEQRRAADRYRAWSDRLVHETIRLGLTKHGAQIEEFVIHCPNATLNEAMTAFFNIVQGCPGESVERQIGVARHAAKLAFTMEEKQFAELCRLCGTIARLAPEKPEDDPVDMGLDFSNVQQILRGWTQRPRDHWGLVPRGVKGPDHRRSMGNGYGGGTKRGQGWDVDIPLRLCGEIWEAGSRGLERNNEIGSPVGIRESAGARTHLAACA